MHTRMHTCTHTHPRTHTQTRILSHTVALPCDSELFPTLQHTSTHTGHCKHRARDIDTGPTHTHTRTRASSHSLWHYLMLRSVCPHCNTLHHLAQDIANIVPETLTQGRDFFRDRQFMFKVGEIVVAFRSDGSRRYGRILQGTLSHNQSLYIRSDK